MFTGIIKSTGLIEDIDNKKNYLRIKSGFSKISIGESISCSGICLTVTKKLRNSFWVNFSPETIKKTNISEFQINKLINLEKSLKLGDELGGHLVFGHVDCVAEVEKITQSSDSRVVLIKVEKQFIKYMASKGSVTLDGVSLTVNDVYKNYFTVNIIPYTWDKTSFINLIVGSKLNLEIDMISRYVFRALKK